MTHSHVNSDFSTDTDFSRLQGVSQIGVDVDLFVRRRSEPHVVRYVSPLNPLRAADHYCSPLSRLGFPQTYSSWIFECGANVPWSESSGRRFQELLNEHKFNRKQFDSLNREFGAHWLTAIDRLPANFSYSLDELKNGTLQRLPIESLAPGISRAISALADDDLLFRHGSVDFNPYCDYPAIRQTSQLFRILGRALWDLTPELIACWIPEGGHCRLCGGVSLPGHDRAWVGRVQPGYCSACLHMTYISDYDDIVTKYLDLKRNAIKVGQRLYALTGSVSIFKEGLWELKISQLNNHVQDECLFLLGIWNGYLRNWIVREFGSWTHFRAEIGISRTRSGHGGYQSVSNCNHECSSDGELQICNELFRHNIPHEIQPKYPKHRHLNPNGLKRADWKIGDLFVEFAGRLNNPEYAEQIEVKKQLASANGIALIILTPGDSIIDALKLHSIHYQDQ
jgi:hypothetical protein